MDNNSFEAEGKKTEENTEVETLGKEHGSMSPLSLRKGAIGCKQDKQLLELIKPLVPGGHCEAHWRTAGLRDR